MEEIHTPNTFTMTEMRAKKDQESVVADLLRTVARNAGRALIAASGYEKRIAIQIPGRREQHLDPLHSWQYSLDYPQLLPASAIIDACEGIAGQLEEMEEQARDRESTIIGRIAGWVAAFASLPMEVRRIVADQYPSIGKVAIGAGILGQIIIGGLASALGAAIVAGLIALYHLL